MSRGRPTARKYEHGWCVAFRYGSVRHQRKFPSLRHPNAKRAAEDYIGRVFRGSSLEDPGLNDQVREYLQWAERTGKKKLTTIKSDQQRLTLFCQWAHLLPAFVQPRP